MIDLFGEPIVEPRPAQRGQAKGYARIPGSGPAGETCKTCAHCHRLRAGNKAFYKCGAHRPYWTHSVGSDIRLKSLACLLWTQKYGNHRRPKTD